MPFAPKIRKDILAALDESIIPMVQEETFRQILAEFPYDFSAAQCRVLKENPLPDREHSPLEMVVKWEQAEMLSFQAPAFGIIYEGTSFERVGLTRSQARLAAEAGKPQDWGIMLLQLPAPALICYPPLVLRGGGGRLAKPFPEQVKALGIKLLSDYVLAHLSWRISEKREDSHSLRIGDGQLSQIGRLYMDELRQPDNGLASRALLLAFLCRLRRHLFQDAPTIGNTSWAEVHAESQLHQTIAGKQNQALCLEVIDYIQSHLNYPLTLPGIAAHFEISAVHLNRIFMVHENTTVMRYVTATRIRAACKILRESPERVSDVARLVGFSSASSFITVFHRQVGMSPTQYRDSERERIS